MLQGLPYHTLQLNHPKELALAKEHNLQLTNVIALFQFVQSASDLARHCKIHTWSIRTSFRIEHKIKVQWEKYIYLQAFTNCPGVRRQGYAANLVAITMSLCTRLCPDHQSSLWDIIIVHHLCVKLKIRADLETPGWTFRVAFHSCHSTCRFHTSLLCRKDWCHCRRRDWKPVEAHCPLIPGNPREVGCPKPKCQTPLETHSVGPPSPFAMARREVAWGVWRVEKGGKSHLNS